MMYLELVCKFEETYAVRDSKKGYMYLKYDDMVQRMAEVPPDERNCKLVNGRVELNTGVLPVFKDGINLVSTFDSRYAGMEYVFDPLAYVMSHTATLLIDDKMLAVIADMGYAPVDTSKLTFKPVGVIGSSDEYHISELSPHIQALVTIHTILENDRLCMLNLTVCNFGKEALTTEQRKFLEYLSRYKFCMFYADERKFLKDKCAECNIPVFEDTHTCA